MIRCLYETTLARMEEKIRRGERKGSFKEATDTGGREVFYL